MGVGMRRTGGCHCGCVRIAVEMPGHRPHYCNCTMCAMKGSLAIDVPVAALTVLEGGELLACYSFNTGVAKHWFCKNCGIHVFQQLRSDPRKYGVNAVCFKGLGRYDFTALAVHDGANAHPKDTGQPARLAGKISYTTMGKTTSSPRT